MSEQWKEYFSLHNHDARGSNARLKDSINKVPDMIEYAHELGLMGIGITDHECLSAHEQALEYMKVHKDDPAWKDFKLGLGNEIYLCNRDVCAENAGNQRYPHFILLALDNYGHQGLRELSTKAWTKNAFMSVMYRVPTYYDDLEEMLETYKGHVIGSSACIGGNLPHYLIYNYEPAVNRHGIDSKEAEQIWDNCLDWIDYMNEIFGKGFFFLELQPHGEDSEHCQEIANKWLIKLAGETGTPYIFTTDSHYLKKEDRNIHRTYLQSKDGEREVDSFYATTYMMSGEELHSYLDKELGYEVVQKGLDNTKLIWDKIQHYELDKPLHLPYIPLDTREPDKKLLDKYKEHVPLLDKFFYSEIDSDRHMTRALLESFEQDPYSQTEEGYAANNECLDYIYRSSVKNKVPWSAYLMQERDYVNQAWEAGSLVGVGRGSGAGFRTLKSLGIIQVDPLRETTKVFPWRFLNPDRVSVLDIDVDIESRMRDKVINKLKETYGEDRVCKVLTYTTEGSRQAILTAARGLGNIDNDTASYIASLIIFDRGKARDLHTMYYGNDDYPASQEFVREMDAHPELWNAAQKIEGLVSGIGSHAGGVVIVDEPFTNRIALMRTKSGDVVTQYDLLEIEKMGEIKVDILCIDALDKIHATLDLLLKDNIIQWQGSLKATYEKYLGVYTLERKSEEMWKLLWNHKVLSLFQMEKESGKQALALTKPHSVDDLATINSVIRLMAQEKGAETPLQKYARFHEDITLWYQEMTDAGLTQEEQEILKDILGVSYGICEAQEYLMLLTMQPQIGGFSLMWSDRLRRAVARKNAKDFNQLEKEFFENAIEKKLSQKLVDYVWYVLIYTQRGYGFGH